MEKTEVCFIRLYPDNPEDALIITYLGTRKRKGEKSRIIKDILYAYFSSEKSLRPEVKSRKKSDPPDYAAAASHKTIIEPSPILHAEIPALSDNDKEALKRNLDELSDMFV
ncbi:MAG TPA: hypothetical protein VJW95_04675 [Dissulfurispiraceae bacterium]|nr:hypothetical protein [Dissulfurispiraceae bacterium]